MAADAAQSDGVSENVEKTPASGAKNFVATCKRTAVAAGGAGFWLGLVGIASKYGEDRFLMPDALSPFSGDNPKKVVESYWGPGLQLLLDVGGTLWKLAGRHVVITLAALALLVAFGYALRRLSDSAIVGARGLAAISIAAAAAALVLIAPWPYFENVLVDDVALDAAFVTPTWMARPATLLWRAVACSHLDETGVIYLTLSGGRLDCNCAHPDLFKDVVDTALVGNALLALAAAFPIFLAARRKSSQAKWMLYAAAAGVVAVSMSGAYIHGKSVHAALFPSRASAERHETVFYLDANTAYSPRTGKTWNEKQPEGTKKDDVVRARFAALVENAQIVRNTQIVRPDR